MSEFGAAAGTVTAGTLLRQAREAAGLHVATLAANLKVPVRKLEALEEDRYDLLPDAVFVRALASSVCRTLKVDPQPVLQLLPQTARPRLGEDSESINAPFRAPGDGPSPGVLDVLKRPVVLIVALLLIGAVVLVFLPLPRQDEPVSTTQPAKTEQVMPPPAAEATLSPAPQGAAATPATRPASAAGAVPTAASVTPAPDAGRAAVTPGASPAPVAAASAATAAPPAAAASASAPADGIVVFRTRGPSWVQVTEAGGATVLRRLMAAGESAGASGKLPLAVTVGDAAQTDVQVRGKPFDLKALARDNVARFEVK